MLGEGRIGNTMCPSGAAVSTGQNTGKYALDRDSWLEILRAVSEGGHLMVLLTFGQTPVLIKAFG